MGVACNAHARGIGLYHKTIIFAGAFHATPLYNVYSHAMPLQQNIYNYENFETDCVFIGFYFYVRQYYLRPVRG
jgi:hypothetical protein